MLKKIKPFFPILFIFLGLMVSQIWFAFHNPMQPLYVEIINDTDELLPSVIIDHGGNALQEKITLLQIKPKEVRTVVLNHKPGMGFNIAVNYANGEKTEICGGKSKDHWFFRETITKFGIYNTSVR